MMRISAFGDELAVDFEEQLQELRRLRIPLIDIRTAWGVNCSQLSDEQVARIKALCEKHAIPVSCIGSPVAKTPIDDPLSVQCDTLKRIAEIAQGLGTRQIRVFSFTHMGAAVDEAMLQRSIAGLAQLTEIAAANDVLLLLENDLGMVGDLPERCLAMLEAIASPHLRFLWDPGNFVHLDVVNQVDGYWDALSPWIGYVHIKDTLLADHSEVVAGAGDGQVGELLSRLHAAGYAGVLSLEPHLLVSERAFGFSGPEGMGRAVAALRGLMAEVGIDEG